MFWLNFSIYPLYWINVCIVAAVIDSGITFNNRVLKQEEQKDD